MLVANIIGHATRRPLTLAHPGGIASMTSHSRREALRIASLGLAGLVPPMDLVLREVRPASVKGLVFEVYKDAGGEFRWRLKAANGRDIATSGEGYQAKTACRSAIDLIKRGAASASITDTT